MDTKKNLDKITKDLISNSYSISDHAVERMTERSISLMDITYLAKSKGLKSPQWSEKHSSWNFSGESFCGDFFSIACTYNNLGTLIVTVFWE